MKQVKFFNYRANPSGVRRLEESVNSWIEEENPDIVDIKITSISLEMKESVIAVVVYNGRPTESEKNETEEQASDNTATSW